MKTVLWTLPIFILQFVLLNNANLIKFNLQTDCTVPEYCDIVEECKGFKLFDLNSAEHHGLKNRIVFIHNGLRNRFSIKLNVAGLLKLNWEKDLAKLAMRYHRRCLTTTPRVAFKGLEAKNPDFKLLTHKKTIEPRVLESIAFNSYNSNLGQKRDDFLVDAISQWYYQHQALQKPQLTYYLSDAFLELIGDNAFAHVVNPQTFTIGCSYSIFHGQQNLLCFYYPFLRNEQNVTYFTKNNYQYQCSYYFPLIDKEFTRLCTLFNYAVDSSSMQKSPGTLMFLLPLLLYLLLVL